MPRSDLYGVLVAALQTGPSLLKQSSFLPGQITTRMTKQKMTESVRCCDIYKRMEGD